MSDTSSVVIQLALEGGPEVSNGVDTVTAKLGGLSSASQSVDVAAQNTAKGAIKASSAADAFDQRITVSFRKLERIANILGNASKRIADQLDASGESSAVIDAVERATVRGLTSAALVTKVSAPLLGPLAPVAGLAVGTGVAAYTAFEAGEAARELAEEHMRLVARDEITEHALTVNAKYAALDRDHAKSIELKMRERARFVELSNALGQSAFY